MQDDLQEKMAMGAVATAGAIIGVANATEGLAHALGNEIAFTAKTKSISGLAMVIFSFTLVPCLTAFYYARIDEDTWLWAFFVMEILNFVILGKYRTEAERRFEAEGLPVYAPTRSVDEIKATEDQAHRTKVNKPEKKTGFLDLLTIMVPVGLFFWMISCEFPMPATILIGMFTAASMAIFRAYVRRS